MRFRKYSRKHAFNILFQWDITGEDLDRIAREYWEGLENAYNAAIKLVENFRSQAQKGEEFDTEVFARKFESLAEEEIIADKLRKLAEAVFVLLKQVEEFHNFALAYTEWLSERNKKRKLKAFQLLNDIKKRLNHLAEADKEHRALIEQLITLVEEAEHNPPENYEQVRELERRFKETVTQIVKVYLDEIEQFARKRLNEDMGEIKEYANKLINAYKEHKVEVDSTIEEFLKDWTIDSLGTVERNLLRLGTAEFLYIGVQDPGRAFNDYIDFAKAYVGKKAAKFVNGVLSAIYNKKVKPKLETRSGNEPSQNPEGNQTAEQPPANPSDSTDSSGGENQNSTAEGKNNVES
jgi:transcription antitermination factor NusB